MRGPEGPPVRPWNDHPLLTVRSATLRAGASLAATFCPVAAIAADGGPASLAEATRDRLPYLARPPGGSRVLLRRKRLPSTGTTCGCNLQTDRQGSEKGAVGTYGPIEWTSLPAVWGNGTKSVIGELLGGYMLIAYSFPLLSVFWSLLMFALLILWIFIVIWCFIDNFRRRDHHGVAKALWFLFIVFVPVIGVLAYIITRPSTEDVEVI